MDVTPMETGRPRTTALFCYECLRLLVLAALLSVTRREGAAGGILPCYMSSNALFPLMALFVWLRPEEYGNYLFLYIAGKVIALVSFLAWEIFSFQTFMAWEDAARSFIVLGGSVFLNMADILSLWTAWTVSKKWRQRRDRPVETAVLAGEGDL